MSYTRVSEIVQRAIDEIVEAGASRKLMEQCMDTVEFKAVQSIADNRRVQLLLDLRNRTADLARQWDVSERTVRNWRNSAIEGKAASAKLAATG
jgi:transposase-like protein